MAVAWCKKHAVTPMDALFSLGRTQLLRHTCVIRRKRIHDGDPRSPFKRLPEVPLPSERRPSPAFRQR